MTDFPLSNRIAVVHLVWLPFGLERFQAFIKSYKLFKADTPHDLIFLFNGVIQQEDITSYLVYSKNENIKFHHFTLKKGQDLEAYYWISRKLSHDYILFLNSYSTILAPGWLLKYVQHIDDRTGVVSATGNYISYYSSVFHKNGISWNSDKTFIENIKKYKLLLKAFFYWQFIFPPFPNPHIRTNAFFMKRDLFLALDFNKPKTKLNAYQFESGKYSLSRQLVKKGLKILIVDKYGRVYTINEWKTSNVFWQGNQENLLIGDNQTAAYDEANDLEKKRLTTLAWG